MADPKNLLELIDQMEPGIRKAFRQSLANIRSDVQFAALESAIRRGDVAAAVRAIGLGESYFRPLDEALRAAHLAGGDWTMKSIKRAARRAGTSITGQFDSRNIRAEGILRQFSSQRITNISQTIRIAVQETLTTAIEAGRAPRSVALDLVGRVGPSGVRVGGVIGLDPSRSALVSDMRTSLSSANGVGVLRYDENGRPVRKFWIGSDGRLKSAYSIRDRRFDGAIKNAILTGSPIPESQINKMTSAYTGRLQRQRGEAIARTELLGSLHAAQDEGVQQIVDSGQVEQDAVSGVWDASGDMFTRDDHRNADGQIRKHGEPFDVGGSMMMRPGDSSLGAPAKQIVNCRCYKRIDIDFMLGLSERLGPDELTLVRALL